MIYTEEDIKSISNSISNYSLTWKKDADKILDFYWGIRDDKSIRSALVVTNGNVQEFIFSKFRYRISKRSDLHPSQFQKEVSKQEKVKKAFYNLLKKLIQENSKIIEDIDFVKAVYKIAEHKAYWRNNISYWTRKSKNAQKDFLDLLKYLYDKYNDIPTFLHKTWYKEISVPEVYFHLAQGKGIKSFNEFPVEMNRKMKHLFLQAPQEYKYLEAILWTEVVTLGGDKRLAENIFNTPAFHSLTGAANNPGEGRRERRKEDYEFWKTVFKFFAEAPMFDYVHVGPIIDYINNRKFINGINMTMKGRNIADLLHATEEWHEQLARQQRELRRNVGYGYHKRDIPVSWKGFEIKPYSKQMGSKDNKYTLIIEEIRTAKELGEEGREMKHCVGSYAWRCADGSVSILSLRKVEKHGLKKSLVTIELNSSGTVVQARGKCNRKPDSSEMSFISAWANERGFKLSSYV